MAHAIKAHEPNERDALVDENEDYDGGLERLVFGGIARDARVDLQETAAIVREGLAVQALELDHGARRQHQVGTKQKDEAVLRRDGVFRYLLPNCVAPDALDA